MVLLQFVVETGSVTNRLLAIAGICVALGAIAGFARQVNKMWQTLNALAKLAQYELNSNGGGSVKDKVQRSLDLSQSAIDAVNALAQEFRSYRDEQRDEQTNVWRAIALSSMTPEPPYTREVTSTVERSKHVVTQQQPEES